MWFPETSPQVLLFMPCATVSEDASSKVGC